MTSILETCLNQAKQVNFPSAQSMVPRHIVKLWSGDDKGRVVLLTLTTVLFTILPVGYNMVVLNVPEKIIQQSINESLFINFGIVLDKGGMSILWSVIVSCQALGALIGCLAVIPILHAYGAKTGMMTVNNIILLVGSVVMSAAYFFNFAPFLLIGRILTGVHTGIACALVPLYIQQVAPKDIKGSLSCFIHIAASFGSSIAAIFSLDFMLGGQTTWGILMALPAILAASQILAALYIPDTPNHLLQKGSYSQAIQAIKFYYDISEEDDDEAIKQYWDMVPEVPEQTSCWTALSTPSTLKGILLGMAVSATQIFSGSMATVSYSSSMFSAVSFIDSLVPFLPALASIVSMLLTVPALQLVETYGRRPLLLKTLVICILADVLLLIFSLLSENKDDWWASWGFALSFVLYGIGYNLGTGPVAYFIPAELVPVEAASSALGAAVATNWICSLLTTLTYYPLNIAIGGWSYLLFIVPTSLLLLILWRFLPETKFCYKADPLEVRLMQDLGSPYGTFDTEVF